MGGGGFALPPNSSGDVPPSSPFREEGGRMHEPLRPPTWPPTGGHLCCPGSGAPNQQGRDQGPVLQSVQALKIARVLTMWARRDGGIGWGCGILLEKLPEAERGPTTKRSGRDPNWQLPGHCRARPPEGGGGTLLPKETSLRQGKPIKEP